MKALKAVSVIVIVVMAGLGPLRAQGAASGGFSRFHIRTGASLLNLAPTLSGELDRWGFGDDFTGVFLFWPVTLEYPDVSRKVPVDFELAYSIDRAFTVGVAMCGLGQAEGTGRDGSTDSGGFVVTGVLVGASANGRAYYVNAAYGPALKPGGRSGGRIGLGVGIADVEAVFETDVERQNMSRHPFCAQVFAGLDIWVVRFLTLGASVQYRYVPAFPAFEIEDEFENRYSIPASSFGLGGLTVGVGLGLHF